jgi:integrase
MARKRKLPDGLRLRGNTYHADFYGGGRRIRKALSTNLDAAVEILNDLKARADRADFDLLDNDYPLPELKEEFLRHCKQQLRPATQSRYTGCLDKVLSSLAVTRVSQLRPELIRAYRDGRLSEGASPRTVNMEVTVLGTMLRWAASPRERKIGSNPLADFDQLPHDHPKEGRALSDEEVGRLLTSSPQPWRDVWYAYLVTGMRKMELANLSFADIDWESRDLVIRSGVAKNHRERRIPVDNGLWEILVRQRDSRNGREPGIAQTPERTEQVRERFTKDHVFVSTMNTPLDHRSNLYHAFLRCCALADIQTETCDAEGRLIEHVDIHSLRRTFATNLIISGADPETVRQLLGHRTLDMVMKIYTKIRNPTKRQALAKLSYGRGTLAPDHVVEYPSQGGFTVQNGQDLVTTEEKKKAN